MDEHYNRYTYPKYSESNSTAFSQNNYNNVYKSSQLSVDQEPDIEYQQLTEYITISSRDRDIEQYPTVSRYTIPLPKEFKNIISLELIQAIVPDKNNVLEEPYLVLQIDELDDVMVSNDRNISDGFALLQLATPNTSGGFIMCDKRIHENTTKYFRTPKASLAKMTVTVNDCDGTPFDFGNDSPNPPNKAFQNTFVFKIISLEKKRNTLKQRNLY